MSALDDLRGHVLNGATEWVRTVVTVCWQELLTEAEVCEYDVAVPIQQDILQLDVAVDDTQLTIEADRNVIHGSFGKS